MNMYATKCVVYTTDDVPLSPSLFLNSSGVLAISWYPPGMKDDNGDTTDDIVPLVLDAAHKYQIKVFMGL